jgi:hypothetical protein
MLSSLFLGCASCAEFANLAAKQGLACSSWGHVQLLQDRTVVYMAGRMSHDGLGLPLCFGGGEGAGFSMGSSGDIWQGRVTVSLSSDCFIYVLLS